VLDRVMRLKLADFLIVERDVGVRECALDHAVVGERRRMLPMRHFDDRRRRAVFDRDDHEGIGAPRQRGLPLGEPSRTIEFRIGGVDFDRWVDLRHGFDEEGAILLFKLVSAFGAGQQ
jgi:hypothetical protein